MEFDNIRECNREKYFIDNIKIQNSIERRILVILKLIIIYLSSGGLDNIRECNGKKYFIDNKKIKFHRETPFNQTKINYNLFIV